MDKEKSNKFFQAVHEDSVKIEQEYKLYVYTGSKRGLAPDVSVKLKLHGKQMESSWIKLTDSLSNKVKFRINQVSFRDYMLKSGLIKTKLINNHNVL